MVNNVIFQVYVGHPELKNAIIKYCSDKNMSVSECIMKIWQQMIDSQNFLMSTNTIHYDSQGLSNSRDKQIAKMLTLSMPYHFINEIDILISKLKKPETKINRSLFTQEGIKRYLEPELIMQGYLVSTIFKNRANATKNLEHLRNELKLSKIEFQKKYLVIEGFQLISYPQYCAIVNKGKGNIDRILDIITDTFGLDKQAFYDDPGIFNEYIKEAL